METSNKNLTSRYNEAVQQVMRLDYLWKMCHSAYLGGDLKKICRILDCVWVELCSDAIRKDKKYFKQMSELDKKIDALGAGIVRYEAELSNLGVDDDNTELKVSLDAVRRQWFRAIKNKQIFLKDLQTAVGKGTSYKNLMEDSII